ncbi:MAG: hypothetical protein Kow0069_12020 [Promethearchaeota archaeon]
MIALIPTLALNPFVLVILASISQTALASAWLLSSAFGDLAARNLTTSGAESGLAETPVAENKAKKMFVESFSLTKQVARALYGALGVVFLDGALLWTLGAWSRSDWWFQLPGVALLWVVGLQYVGLAFVRRSTFVDWLYAAAVALAWVAFIHVWVPADPVMGLRLKGTASTVVAAFAAGAAFVALLKRGVPSLRKAATWSDDAAGAPSGLLGPKAVALTWALIVAESLLSFSGRSLITAWLS